MPRQACALFTYAVTMARVKNYYIWLQQLGISNSIFCCSHTYARYICSLWNRDKSTANGCKWMTKESGVQVSVAKNFLF
jgi:hypothetical protein